MSAAATELDLVTSSDDRYFVPVETKRQLIQQDMQMWKNTLFQAESRHRTYKRIGKTELEAEQVKILQDCESALMDLDEQLSAL